MGLFDRLNPLMQTYEGLRATGPSPIEVSFDEILSPTEGVIDGKRVVLAGTNNYLGLTFDPHCIEAGVSTLQKSGTGTTGSRMANGTYSNHKMLENELAAHYGKDHAMVFSTGYQANLGIISQAAGPDDVLLIDSDSHASIYDATRLSNAEVLRFRHNDPENLDRRLRRLADRDCNKVVVLEGIYSMMGDTSPLKEFVDVCKAHDAYIIVDEAHSMGVLGDTGCGLCEEVGVQDDVDFIVGTFSKSLGAVGGYCVSSVEDFNVLRAAARAYMFTASLPPAVMATVREALHQMQERPELRVKLWSNIDLLYNSLDRAGFLLGPEESPIIAIQVDTPELAVDSWRKLVDAGYYVNLAMSPATPGGINLLRISVSAAHTAQQLRGLVGAITDIAIDNGVLKTPLAASGR